MKVGNKALDKEKPGQDFLLYEDPVPILIKKHFEYELSHCVNSVQDVDLQKYEDFRAKYDPNFSFDKKRSWS